MSGIGGKKDSTSAHIGVPLTRSASEARALLLRPGIRPLVDARGNRAFANFSTVTLPMVPVDQEKRYV
jgi:hypothetical protein